MKPNHVKYLFAVAGFMLAAVFSASAQTATTKGMDRSKLNIGAYHLQPYASTEAHVKDVADCGIDFMLCIRTDRKLLDLFQKYNVGAVLNQVGRRRKQRRKAEDEEYDPGISACCKAIQRPSGSMGYRYRRRALGTRLPLLWRGIQGNAAPVPRQDDLSESLSELCVGG